MLKLIFLLIFQAAVYAAARSFDCRKSGFAAFSRKLRCVLRLCCPLAADNSTLTSRKVFSATHMSRRKTNYTAFASADAKLCEAFLTCGAQSLTSFAHAAALAALPLPWNTFPSTSFAPGQLGASFCRVLPMPLVPEVAKTTTVLPERS